ncbi:MAG: polysaccharide lyase [Cyanobacteria bacterium P01_E01_bin.6]
MLPDFSTPVVAFSSYSNAPEQLTSNETWFNSLFSDDIGDDAIASPVASFVVEDSNGNKDIVTGIHQESTLVGKSTLVGASSLDQAQYAAANEQTSSNSSNTSQNVAKSTFRSDKVARFEVRKTDPLASGSFRSEISTPHEPIGAELSYEFSLLLPSNWKTDPSGEIISQWHSAPDRSKGETWPGKNPPISIHVDGNEMYIKANWNTGSGKKSSIFWRGSYQKGDWTDWVVNTKWSNSSNGYIKIQQFSFWILKPL